ncbi:MAG: stage II sporulation protein R [Clostridiales bacterium]|jgi:stage II sporulation protein R|nr:stage II sporulation protein R [Clostridiales bacterium]
MKIKAIRRALLCGLIFTAGWATMVYSETVQSDLARSVIRFHVLANSDSDEDQSLKLSVRDEVLSRLKTELSSAQSVEETRRIIKSKLPEIESDAAAFVKTLGYNYPVKASLSRDFFPTKTYGDITFFPGEYEALRVVIGEGGGRNWWCVMFPPLCFVDVSKGKVPEENKQQLKSAVDKEYALLSDETREKKITINVKFKIVEWWQNLLHKDKDKDKNNEKKTDGYVVKTPVGAKDK